MKLGFVIYGSLDTVSGGYLYDRKLVDYLRAQGDTVEIISLPWRNYGAHLMDNLRFRLPTSDVIARSEATKRRRGAMATQSPINRPFDLVIQDELNHPSLIAANRARHPYPIVSLVHHLRCSELRPEWQNAFYGVIERKYLQSVAGFIFNSRTTQRVVNRLIGDGKPGLVAYPPTDRFGEAISDQEIRERASGNELRILFLGNVIFRKGLHTLLEALNIVRRDTPFRAVAPYRLDVVGGVAAEPRYAAGMERYVRTHGLSSIVKFHGALDNQPLIEKYRQAQVTVVPSSYEGFGIVYLEGMCFGLPAIGTTAGAAGEIITHGKDGYLIEPNDVTALADHLKQLVQDRDLLVKLSLNAAKRYRSQPKWDETANSIREFLYVIARGASPEAA